MMPLQFDRDFLEFNVNIHDLEIQLQAFVNASFEHITSTEHALSLLQQFQAILQRETLRQDLESKCVRWRLCQQGVQCGWEHCIHEWGR